MLKRNASSANYKNPRVSVPRALVLCQTAALRHLVRSACKPLPSKPYNFLCCNFAPSCRLCHPGSRLCAQAKSGRRLVVGCLTSRRFGPRCATSCSGDTCRCFLPTTTLLSLCCCRGTSFACCPCPPAKSGFLSRCLSCRPASRPLGSRRANSGLCGDLARCRRRFIEQRHLPAWQGEVPMQGLRGRQHLPAWQGEERLQGLRGRQHLPAW